MVELVIKRLEYLCEYTNVWLVVGVIDDGKCLIS